MLSPVSNPPDQAPKAGKLERALNVFNMLASTAKIGLGAADVKASFDKNKLLKKETPLSKSTKLWTDEADVGVA